MGFPGSGGFGDNEIPDIPHDGSGTSTGGSDLGGTTGGGSGSGVGLGVTDLAQDEVSGDLGSLPITNLRKEFLTKSLRLNAADNVPRLHVHRYRGQREAFKFNYYLQSVMSLSAYVFWALRDRDENLRVQELATGPAEHSTPTSSEVALIYHIQAQITFKEWLLSKDQDVRWFV